MPVLPKIPTKGIPTMRRRGIQQGVFSAAAAAAFTPGGISGCIGWWDASDAATITASSGSVSQWNDKSGTGHHLTQGTGANQPTTGTRTQNGLNVIDFDGTGDFMLASYSPVAQPVTLWIVHKFDSLAATQWIFGCTSSAGNTGWLYFQPGDVMLTLFGAFAGDGAGSTSTRAIASRINGASSIMRINGVNGSAYNAGAASWAESDTRTYFGAVFGGASNFFDGYVCEAALYSASVSAGDLTSLDTYSTAKWAVP